mgnify:CR=1 FL=1
MKFGAEYVSMPPTQRYALRACALHFSARGMRCVFEHHEHMVWVGGICHLPHHAPMSRSR